MSKADTVHPGASSVMTDAVLRAFQWLIIKYNSDEF